MSKFQNDEFSRLVEYTMRMRISAEKLMELNLECAMMPIQGLTQEDRISEATSVNQVVKMQCDMIASLVEKYIELAEMADMMYDIIKAAAEKSGYPGEFPE